MNLCVVSSFQGDLEEFMSMMEEFGEEIKRIIFEKNTDKNVCPIIDKFSDF
jgi:hypothetical protein